LPPTPLSRGLRSSLRRLAPVFQDYPDKARKLYCSKASKAHLRVGFCLSFVFCESGLFHAFEQSLEEIMVIFFVLEDLLEDLRSGDVAFRLRHGDGLLI